MASPKLVYCDTPIFISYLTGADADRLRVLDEVFDMQERGLLRIVISTLVIAEARRIRVPNSPGLVAGEGEHNLQCLPFDGQRVELIEQMFQSDLLEYMPLTTRIAQHAAHIGNEWPSLLPPDCIHVATAVEAGAEMLFTWDGSGAKRRRPGKMLRYDRKIGDPPLKIVEPYPPYDHPLFEKA